jgi:hypothetical protein
MQTISALDHKYTFKERFSKRVFTRFHMSFILLGTAIAGLILSKLLLVIGIHNMVIRYIIALVGAYLCFFILMKLWLNYLTSPYRQKRNKENMADLVDVVVNIPDSLPSGSGSVVTGHGGQFGGGGASGFWQSSHEIPSHAILETTSIVESASDTAVETVGDAASSVAEESVLLLIPLALLLLSIFGGGIYLIYEAPVIISEAAFELILATSLINSAKKIDNPDWVGSVFRSTLPAFIFTLVATIIMGSILMYSCPKATKVIEVVRLCL